MFDVVPGPAASTTTTTTSTTTAAAPAAAAGAPSRAAGLDDVLQRVGRYVAGYGQQASLLVGIEHYEQRLLGTTGLEISRRVMTAEFALVKTADVIGWSGFRDVIEVDGRHLADHRNRLQTLFRSSTPNAAEARRIADESARFNLGPVRRNINDPMAALFFLTAALQPRFAFERKGESSIDGVTVLELEFKEKTRPTLIRTSTGRDVPCAGTVWVNPADGTVVRTVLSVAGVTGNSGSKVDVTYARDARLDLWLPATMQERHETDIAEVGRSAFGATTGALRSSVLLATATYSDFKRFETSATFKVK